MMKVFVSGADRGLGSALTEKMLERGFTVFAGQFMPDWPELDALVKKYPTTLKIIPLDVTSDTSVEQAAKLVTELTDQLDVLIGNAGIMGWLADVMPTITDTQMMADVYNVNVIGNVRLVEHFLPLLEKGTTRKICIMTSEAGSITTYGRPTLHWYSSTKAALNHYTKTLFNRYRQDDFKFRLYHPGWINTYMNGVLETKAHYDSPEAADMSMDYFFDAVVDEDQLVLYTCEKEIMPF